MGGGFHNWINAALQRLFQSSFNFEAALLLMKGDDRIGRTGKSKRSQSKLRGGAEK